MNLGDLLTDTIGIVVDKASIEEAEVDDLLDGSIGLITKPSGEV